MTKKLLAALLAFVMMISALPAQGLVTAAASDAAAGTPALSDAAIVSGSSISTPPLAKNTIRAAYEKTKIHKLVYEVTAENLAENTKIDAVRSGWATDTVTLNHTETGTQELTIMDQADIDGMINMGFVYDHTEEVQGDDGNPKTEYSLTTEGASVTVHKMVVNDTYEIPLSITLNSSSKDLKNIWSGLSDNEILYEGSNSYFAFDSAAADQGLICFYTKASQEAPDTPSEAYKAVQIQKLAYGFQASGISKETNFEMVADPGYTRKTEKLDNNMSDMTFSFDSPMDGIINFGYLYDDVDSGNNNILSDTNVSMQIQKIIVNDTYEVSLNETLSSNTTNSLVNIYWPTDRPDGDKIYTGDGCYFAYDAAANLFKFYIKSDGLPDTPQINTETPSMQYVKAMGSGWNLGNSLESINSNLDEPDKLEESWSNPVVTRELLHSVKEKGFSNVRIPLTFYRRYTVNENAGENEYKYVINQSYLDRAKEVIGWALDEGFYVMTNIHHDSWLWLSKWDGDPASEEYRMYKDFWGQLADAFQDTSDKLCFETINEYEPGDKSDENNSKNPATQKKVMDINKAAYDVIRASGGNNATRMIVMPSFLHNHKTENSSVLSNFIKGLNDDNIIATVHYYSEWVYASNIGRTGFDEELFDGQPGFTPRKSVDEFMEELRKQFLCDGIGVIVSEYGVLGYDTGDNCMQIGEELKYYDYMNQAARENNVCLMFWDNGSAISRYDYHWKYARVGDVLEKTMTDRISYATELDTIYLNGPASQDIQIPLTLNGKQFTGIAGLTEGSEYTYTDAVLTLSKDYVNGLLENAGGYGTLKDLAISFDNGYVWHEYLVYYGTPQYQEAAGTKELIEIPFIYNGSQIRRISTYQAAGRVGPRCAWWNWLYYGKEFKVDESGQTLSFTNEFFSDESVKDGLLKAIVEFYDGQFLNVYMNIEGDIVTCTPQAADGPIDLDCAKLVILYAGETEIPSQYVTAPEGYTITGIYTDDTTNMVTLSGWPVVMTFDTKAHENTAGLSFWLRYMDLEKRCDITFGIKDAPGVNPMSLETGNSAKITVTNLTEDASCTYGLSDTSIADVAADGTVTAKKAGTAKIRVTVTQYGRTDTFEADLTVTGDKQEDNNGDSNSGNGNDSSGNGNSGNGSSGNGNSGSGSSGNGSYGYGGSGFGSGSNSGTPAGNGSNTDGSGSKPDASETPGSPDGSGSGNQAGNGSQPGSGSQNDAGHQPDPAKTGTIIKDSMVKGTFQVTKSDSASPEVSYTGLKNASSAIIPATITDADGTVYRVTSIAKNAFKGNQKLKIVKIGSNITSIGAHAFQGCKKLTKLVFSRNITKIGSHAFQNCTNLTSVQIPGNVKTIEAGTFSGCTKLKTATIAGSVTAIKDQAFYNCKKLTKLTVPGKVASIGKQAFYNCKSLKTITIRTTKLTSKTIGKQAFKGISKKTIIRVPKSKKNAYQKLLQAKGLNVKVKIKAF